MPRKGENIFKRKDGRWEARCIHHYEGGKAVYRYLYARSYAEAKAKKSEELSRPQACRCAVPKQLATFEDVAFLWLKDKKCTVKESTYARYYRAIDKYLLPILKDVQLMKTDAGFFRGLTDTLLRSGVNGQGLSPKSVTDILCVLSAVLKYGRENDYPVPSGKCIKYPAKIQQNAEIISDEELLKIKNALLMNSQSSIGLGIIFTLYTGVRIGELCGLKWGDINLDEKTVRISRTVERISDINKTNGKKTKVIVSEPKTQNSVRTIPLVSELVEFLETRRQSDDCCLLTNTEKFTEPHQYYVKYRRFLAENGISAYSFHTLRHTFATRCVSVGIDTKSLSEILGHRRVETTLKFYVHPSLRQKRDQLERLSASYSQSK